jgi:hypothetical protein
VSKRGKKLQLEIRAFLQQYGRKGKAHGEPNDRRYDRKIVALVQRMTPEELDALMNEPDIEEIEIEDDTERDRPV